jgi:hypothetical protein
VDGASVSQCLRIGDSSNLNLLKFFERAVSGTLAPLLLNEVVMTDGTLTHAPRNDRPAVVVMPVTKLVSRPAVTIVNGRLVAVKVLVDRKAA